MGEHDEQPDRLEGAQVFVEAAPRPIAGGRWYVRADDTVVYQHPTGEWRQPAIVSAETLRQSSSWTRSA